jgi:hypothetical protein
MVKWLLAAVILYGGFVALLYVAQRFVQYFPERRRTAPWAAGLPEAEEAVLDTADGKRVIVWHVPPREGHPIFLYLHGNGGSLRWRAERFRSLTADGSGLVALSYRGYGGSSGRPTDTGLTPRQPTPLPSRAIPPIASSCGANRSAPRSRWHWQQKSQSGTSWQAAPWVARSPLRSSGSWSAHTGSFEQIAARSRAPRSTLAIRGAVPTMPPTSPEHPLWRCR